MDVSRCWGHTRGSYNKFLSWTRLRLKAPAFTLGFDGPRRGKCPHISFCVKSVTEESMALIPDGSLATDISSICDSWVDFYTDLFSAEPVDASAQNLLLGHLSSQLPSEASCACDGLLSVDEVFRALEGMALEKSPGSDGLSAEFYRSFWHILGADLVDVLNDSFSSGLLPPLYVGPLSLSFSRKATVSNVKIGGQSVYLTSIINSVLGPSLVASLRFYIISLVLTRPTAYLAASSAKMRSSCRLYV